jgi:hypothetical protein
LCPERDDTLDRFAASVEGDDVVFLAEEPTCYGEAHVSQADKPDFHHELLAVIQFGERLAGNAKAIDRGRHASVDGDL